MNIMTTTQTQIVANPFAAPSGAVSTPVADQATAASDQARAVAEVQAALMIARMNPRDPVKAMDRILNACTRPTLANAATYSYSRGGSDITGPTIRLAEAIAQGWGNIQYGIREISQGKNVSTVESYAWDVETNTRRQVVFQVAHKRDTRKGTKILTDSRDIYELIANQGARRLRACILGVIPGDVVEAALAQCAVTQRAHVDMTPEGLQKLVESFATFGVSKSQIEKRIQRRLDAIQPAQVLSLRNIYRSLRDGMSVPADWFEPEAATAIPAKKGAAALKDKLKKKEEAPVPEPTPTPEPTPAAEAGPVAEEAKAEEPAPEAPAHEAPKPQQIDHADLPDAGAPEPEPDPWLEAYEKSISS